MKQSPRTRPVIKRKNKSNEVLLTIEGLIYPILNLIVFFTKAYPTYGTEFKNFDGITKKKDDFKSENYNFLFSKKINTNTIKVAEQKEKLKKINRQIRRQEEREESNVLKNESIYDSLIKCCSGCLT